MSGPRIGSLFAGYGGLDLALAEVWPDAHPVWFSQYDPDGGTRQAPSRILAHHWPDIPNLGDITAIDWSAVEPVDIITGGSPCQDLSHAGKRAGMKAGTRSGLWASMCDAIDTLRPSLVIWENVRGAYSATAASAVEPCPICVGERPGVTLRALGRVLGDLAECGYDAAWVGLRAADVGAPHGRFRVFVLGWPAADAHGTTRGERWLAADGEAEGGRSRADAGGSDRAPLTLLPTPAVNDMGAGKTVDAWDAWTASMQARHGNGNGHGASLSIEALRMLPTPTTRDLKGRNQRDDETCLTGALMPTPRSTRGGSGTETMYVLGAERSDDDRPQGRVLLPTPTSTDRKASGASYPTTATHSQGTTLTGATVRQAADFGTYAPAIARWEALTRPAPAPTEPTGKGGAHRLSPRFVEHMMGLSDGWVTDVPGITRNDMLKALGNGVVPQQAAEAVRWLLEVRATAVAA